MLNRFRLVICILFIACTKVYAEQKIITTDTHPLWDTKTMITVDDLLSALTNKDPLEVMHAQVYIMGVLDTSEGRTWCGYGGALPHDMTMYVFGTLRRLEPRRRTERAAYVITDHLAKLLPCKKGKK